MGLSLTACSEDDLDTNQYQQGVHLNVYGPQPVMRGGQLRFLGSNLDQISKIQIPGCDEITNIEVVKAGIPSEIKITVPKDGPLVGYLTLITKTDEEIKTKTQLTYEEPIVFTSFSPVADTGICWMGFLFQSICKGKNLYFDFFGCPWFFSCSF